MATRRRKALRHTRRRHRGGKIIGEGTSAFVIDPPVECKGKSEEQMKKYVTRIAKIGDKKELVTKNHPDLIQKLRELDPRQEYFYYPEPCDAGKLTQENKLDGVTYSNKKFIEIVQKGSDVWNPVMRQKRSWNAFFKGKKTGKKIPWTGKSKEQLDHLEKAVELLHKNKIVHGDLHGRNVVMGDGDMPRIIDFEYSTMGATEKQIEQEKNAFEDSFPSLDTDWRKSR